ncbi:hypothetical protein BR93DRAFT_867494, partial [Coniochaeta sp. PMI_546]
QKRLRQWGLVSCETRLQPSNDDVKGPLGLNVLHEPSDPRYDFVFVHGLLGGSKKTWSHSPEPGMFWPRDWLPSEAGFEHVRLHSYGYNSDWTSKKESHLSIYDFGQALLADLHNSPHLRRAPETSIVLVTHSMGGLVAKQAYLLSNENPTYHSIFRRIQGIYFLGTPHRGAALARLVKLLCHKGVLRSKAFVDELVPGSASLDRDGEDILSALEQKHHPGSCEWLTAHDTFQDWIGLGISRTFQAEEEPEAKTLWLSGRPGTGKSVAAAHVIKLLKDAHLDTSFYFFRHNDRDGSKVSSLLRSVALQMASYNHHVRETLFTMTEDGVAISHDDHHTLWKRVFVDRILKSERTTPHFWVIDAVDECPTKEITELVSILSNLNAVPFFRVFLTARPGGQLGNSLTQNSASYSEIKVGQDETKKDIELYLTARCFPRSDPRFYPNLVSEIVSNSRGVFLWASLIMCKLEDAYSIEDMKDILHNIPSEMDDFYTRILTSIITSPSSEIAKCALRWVISSPKPLTIEELACAIKMDIGRTLTATPSQLEAILGHLIYVDDQRRTYIAHETATSFLTQARDGFWIDRTSAHSTLAEICLRILSGPEFAPPRSHRHASSRQPAAGCILSAYASAYFSYHLLHGSHSADQLFRPLDTFLRTNMGTWLEKLAHTGDL